MEIRRLGLETLHNILQRQVIPYSSARKLCSRCSVVSASAPFSKSASQSTPSLPISRVSPTTRLPASLHQHAWAVWSTGGHEYRPDSSGESFLGLSTRCRRSGKSRTLNQRTARCECTFCLRFYVWAPTRDPSLDSWDECGRSFLKAPAHISAHFRSTSAPPPYELLFMRTIRVVHGKITLCHNRVLKSLV
ncbi:hypothetical protein BGY98DRAFT_37437 [Russula aff. rugulosa BPL654]|nr:hypothetical protein BGY98DRAFT_37437 [Russula aff. rugulosa BPL654]